MTRESIRMVSRLYTLSTGNKMSTLEMYPGQFSTIYYRICSLKFYTLTLPQGWSYSTIVYVSIYQYSHILVILCSFIGLLYSTVKHTSTICANKIMSDHIVCLDRHLVQNIIGPPAPESLPSLCSSSSFETETITGS